MAKKTIYIIISIAILAAVIAWALAYFPQRDNGQNYYQKRQQMVETQLLARGISDREVIEAMSKVPRHEFVSPDQQDAAYQDRPLPIGEGQTISQPYIVALMTEELSLRPGQKVLEIGTGSGYQAAVLAEITDKVYTVEIIAGLYETARQRLKQMYPYVEVSHHDGYYGWEEHAPYERIIVTAAPDHIPQPLVSQLTEGGIMVIPVGPPGWNQVLWKVTKTEGRIQTERILDVVFVPLLGGD
ncbi:MAG: protein-L-isoaspartate(D-aspartate) O-methyltransferase [Actinomycetota bacterium]